MAVTRPDQASDARAIEAFVDATQKDFVSGEAKDAALRDFARSFKTCFAICASQLLSEPPPDEFKQLKREIYNCTELGQVRHFIQKEKMSDAVVLEKLKKEKAMRCERSITLGQAISKVIEIIQPKLPLFDEVVAQLEVKADEKLQETVFALHSQAMFSKVSVWLRIHMTEKAREYGATYSLEPKLFLEKIFPRLIALQAQEFIKIQGKTFLEQYPILKNFFAGKAIFRPAYHILFHDERFLGAYDACVLADNLIVSATPRTAAHVEQLCDTLVFNSRCSPVQYVAVVGDETEFHDYFQFSGPPKQFGKYELTVEALSAAEEKSCSRESRLLIRKNTGETAYLGMYYFKTSDRDSLSLTHESDLRRLYEFYKKRDDSIIMVQCITGAKKAGLLAVPIILAGERDKFFVGGDTMTDTVNKIHRGLFELRQPLPALAYSAKQFATIIRTTVLLNEYELKLSFSLRVERPSVSPQNTATQFQGQASPSRATKPSARALGAHQRGTSADGMWSQVPPTPHNSRASSPVNAADKVVSATGLSRSG